MAMTLEQQSARRKFIYFGLILVLLTASLVHRKLVIDTQADNLMLREVGRGKADLTDSAVRLTLSGVRGVAVTSLWLAAIERQRKHEWNELEVVVDSLTHLQPRFISPWLFQGWNLAFNVSVECDWLRDKYYFISRGITMLARGEEKNDPGQASPPKDWPANSDMRFNVGFWYQLKLGTSDEHRTLQCLFDMSCIPASKRNPESFYKAGTRGKMVDLEKFRQFCEENPRFVRRLRERIPGKGYEEPDNVIQFLGEYKDIPARVEERSKLDEEKRLDEFPVLPPAKYAANAKPSYPDWKAQSLITSQDDFDVYSCTRAWYSFSQLPLPPENADPGADSGAQDRTKYSYPKMATIIFRSYPAIAQVYISQELQKDGWFDGEGWEITKWFDNLQVGAGRVGVGPTGGIVVGGGPRYDSRSAWKLANELFFLYGQKNGLMITAEEFNQLAQRAQVDSKALQRFNRIVGNRTMTNFEEQYQITVVEKTAEAVAARKEIFAIKNREQSSKNVLAKYRDRVLPQWLDLILRFPDFRRLAQIQEDSYELAAEYYRLLQYYNREYFEGLVSNVAYANIATVMPGTMIPLFDPKGDMAKVWPQTILKQHLDKGGVKVLYIRDFEGMYDQMFVNDDPKAAPIKDIAPSLARAFLWPPPPPAAAADFAFARHVVWPVPPGKSGAHPEIGLGNQYDWNAIKKNKEAFADTKALPLFLLLSSAEERRILTMTASHRYPPQAEGWKPLIALATIYQMRQTIPWLKQRPGNTRPDLPPGAIENPPVPPPGFGSAIEAKKI
jgi:hypothetical protein